jgi:glutamate racemase
LCYLLNVLAVVYVVTASVAPAVNNSTDVLVTAIASNVSIQSPPFLHQFNQQHSTTTSATVSTPNVTAKPAIK